VQNTSSATPTEANTFDNTVYVLIVTDSPLTKKYVASILREIINLGNVISLPDRKQALQHIQNNRSQHCSFIFYEDTISVETQRPFIEALRQEPATASTPVVVLGQQQPEGHDPEIARRQLSTFLQRPFIPSTLITLLFELFQEKDRRLAKRIDTNKLPCRVDMGYYATKPYTGQLVNISYTGCLLQTAHNIEDCGGMDDVGSISFNTADSGDIHLSGRIIRAEAGKYQQIGFQFQYNEEQDLVKLGRFITALSKASPA